MDREKIICIFCGRIAQIKEQDDLKIVVCPKCKRETELAAYQDIFDQWLGDIRNKDNWRVIYGCLGKYNCLIH